MVGGRIIVPVIFVFEKAQLPMCFNWLGNSMLTTLSILLKALSAIRVTGSPSIVSGITTFPPLPTYLLMRISVPFEAYRKSEALLAIFLWLGAAAVLFSALRMGAPSYIGSITFLSSALDTKTIALCAFSSEIP